MHTRLGEWECEDKLNSDTYDNYYCKFITIEMILYYRYRNALYRGYLHSCSDWIVYPGKDNPSPAAQATENAAITKILRRVLTPEVFITLTRNRKIDLSIIIVDQFTKVDRRSGTVLSQQRFKKYSASTHPNEIRTTCKLTSFWQVSAKHLVTPCSESRVRLQINITFSPRGVSENPSRFGRFSEIIFFLQTIFDNAVSCSRNIVSNFDVCWVE